MHVGGKGAMWKVSGTEFAISQSPGSLSHVPVRKPQEPSNLLQVVTGMAEGPDRDTAVRTHGKSSMRKMRRVHIHEETVYVCPACLCMPHIYKREHVCACTQITL